MEGTEYGRTMQHGDDSSELRDCGDVELTTPDVDGPRVQRHDNQGTYSFPCPAVQRIVVKAAEPRIVELLVASGVRLVTWRLPSELDRAPTGASRSTTTTCSTSTRCCSATTGSTA